MGVRVNPMAQGHGLALRACTHMTSCTRQGPSFVRYGRCTLCLGQAATLLSSWLVPSAETYGCPASSRRSLVTRRTSVYNISALVPYATIAVLRIRRIVIIFRSFVAAAGARARLRGPAARPTTQRRGRAATQTIYSGRVHTESHRPDGSRHQPPDAADGSGRCTADQVPTAW